MILTYFRLAVIDTLLLPRVASLAAATHQLHQGPEAAQEVVLDMDLWEAPHQEELLYHPQGLLQHQRSQE